MGQGLGLGDQVECGLVRLGLDLEAAHGLDGLGGQAEVAHDRDLGVEDGLDHGQALATALELDRAGAGPDQLGGVLHGLLRRDVVAHPRQVAHDQRAGPGPGHRGGVVGQVVDGHLEGVLVAEHDHGDRVADQDQVDARLIPASSAMRAPGAS